MKSIIIFFFCNIWSIFLSAQAVINCDKDFLLGKFNPENHSAFVIIPKELCNRSNLYLQKDVLMAYKKMYKAAKQDGVELKIISATRNFEYQKKIWNRKWLAQNKGKKSIDKVKNLLKYSAMPGTSRHHWGTDVDLNDLNDSYFQSGNGKKVYDWLIKNANSYGFYQPYTSKINEVRTGYEEEKWHWTYLPLSKNYVKLIRKCINADDIFEFNGCTFVGELQIIDNYILGIHKTCK